MLQQGSILRDRYRIARKVGGGGMGDIYRAWDLTFNMPVALKEMHPQPNLNEQLQQHLRDQFFREAQTVAQFQHPNLVNVTDYFVERDNDYLVMRFVEGTDLETIIEQQGALPEAHVLAWADQLLDALSYIHRQAVIHRDIKPANIIIQADGTPVLVDFGLVKLWDPNDPRTQAIIDGMGTPSYAPPEQHGGNTSNTEPRSDLYSLCATLHHALTGQAPPHLSQLLSGQVSLSPPDMLNANVSPHVSQAIMRGMSLNVNDRYQSADELRQALHTPLVQEKTKSFPVWMIGAIAVLVLLIGGMGVYAYISESDDTTIGDRPTETATPQNGSTEDNIPPTSTDDITEDVTIETPTSTTPAPTPTPTPSPTSTPSPTPLPRAVLSADNAAQMVELDQWGEAALGGADFSATEDFLLASVEGGMLIYDATTLNESNENIEPLQQIEVGAAVSFSTPADGSRMLAFYHDGTIRIWDVATSEVLTEFIGHEDTLTGATYSEDGEKFYVGTDTGILMMWDAVNQTVEWEVQAHDESIRFARFSDNTRYIVTVSEDYTMKIWEVADGSLVSTLSHLDADGFNWWITSVVFSADGSLFASSGRGGAVKVWRVGDETPLYDDIDPANDIVYALDFSPDGQELAVGSEIGEIKFYRVSDKALSRTITAAHNGWVVHLSYDRTGEKLASTGTDARWKIFSVPDNRLLHTETGAASLYDLAYIASSSNDKLVTISNDWITRVWSMATGAIIAEYSNILPSTLAVSPDGSKIVVGTTNRSVFIHTEGSIPIVIREAHTERINGIEFVRGGEQFVTVSSDGTLKLWDVEDGTLQTTLNNEDVNWIGQAAVFPNNDSALSVSTRNGVGFISLEDESFENIELDFGTFAIVYSPNERYLVFSNYEGRLFLIDFEGDNEDERDAHGEFINAISFSSDGTLFATASNDATIKVWQIVENEGLELLHTLEGHFNGVSDVTFTADGKSLISSSYDGTIRFWGVLGE